LRYIIAMKREKVHSITGGMQFRVNAIRATEASKDKAYVELILLHSYPSINGNGVTLLPKVLYNSLESIKNSPLDIDHEMEGVWFWEDGDPNRVIGSVVDARLNPEYSEGLVPENGYELIITAVLWKRLKDVKAIIQDIQDNTNEWKASFEIAPYSVNKQIFFHHNGQMYSEESAPSEMREAWEWGEPYQGSPVALAFGGNDGKIDFYGAALTLTPADENTKILNLVANKRRAMDAKQLLADFRALIAEEANKYDGYVSPEALATAIEEAKSEVEAKYKDYVSPEDLSSRIASAKEEMKSEVSQKYETFISRLDTMRESAVLVTDERKQMAMDATDEDFTNSLTTWVNSMKEMTEELEKADVEITDEMKNNIATWNGKEDDRFKVVLAALKKPVTVPTTETSGEQFSFYN